VNQIRATIDDRYDRFFPSGLGFSIPKAMAVHTLFLSIRIQNFTINTGFHHQLPLSHFARLGSRFPQCEISSPEKYATSASLDFQFNHLE
jgi:hypothetical protein